MSIAEKDILQSPSSCAGAQLLALQALATQGMGGGSELASQQDLANNREMLEDVKELECSHLKLAEKVPSEFCDEHCDRENCMRWTGQTAMLTNMQILRIKGTEGLKEHLSRLDEADYYLSDGTACPYLTDPDEGSVAAVIEDLRRSGAPGENDDIIFPDLDPRTGEALARGVDLEALDELRNSQGGESRLDHHPRPRRRSAHGPKNYRAGQLALDLTQQLKLDLAL